MRVALVVAVVACGGKPAPKQDAGRPPADATAVVAELPARPFGATELAAFDWRKRGGQSAFLAARKAEDREDWPAAVIACKQALAADPTHLEAAWLLAAGNAKLGKLDEVLPPLLVAAGGDFGKWADASLELPAMQAFLATPQGAAWRRRVRDDHPRYTAALARSVIVFANGDLFAVDPEGNRWYRITRTGGGTVGVLVAGDAHRLAYVARTRSKKVTHVGIGIVDLVSGRATRPVDSGITGLFQLAHAPTGFWVSANGAARLVDDDARYHAIPGKPVRPGGPWLEVSGKSTRLHRLPIADVSADWDDKSLASAMKIGRSNRIVSVPSPGLIDGNTIAWAPDHAHLALVAQLDDHCTPGAISAAAFVADAATGKVTELERAAGGLAIDWLSDHALAIAGDKGVSIVELSGGKTPIASAAGLVAPRRKPRCTPEEPPDEPPVEDETEATVGVENRSDH